MMRRPPNACRSIARGKEAAPIFIFSNLAGIAREMCYTFEMKILMAIILLTFGLISPALAGETRDAFQRGTAAQRSGDNAAALKEYQFAAERGDADAQGKLGIMYMYGGRGISQDLVQAHMWLSLAAGNSSPGTDRAASVTNGMMTTGLMNPAQIAEAQKLAHEWTETHVTASQ